MSELNVKVCQIAEIKPHPNADKLELAIIGGWQSVVGKGEFKQGDLVVYFPPDTMLLEGWTNQFGVTQYCQKQPEGMMRIRKTRLRGEPSFGLVVPYEPVLYWDGDGDPIGNDLAEMFGAKKYEPPILGQQGDILGGTPGDFHRFTDIENLRNWPNILHEGEEVICTEKIHGTCVRLGVVSGEIYAASKNHARKRPSEEAMRANWYWHSYLIPGVKKLLDEWEEMKDASFIGMLFGETYGTVQSLRYGINGLAFRCFGIACNGSYHHYDDRVKLCNTYEIPMVPEIYRGPYSLEKMIELADGPTMVSGENVREGIVIQPVRERTDARVGRVILKCVSTEYLMSKESDKDTTDA